MDDGDPYGVPELQNVPAAARAKFKVLIVGSGMSGLLAGIRLQEAGIPFEYWNATRTSRPRGNRNCGQSSAETVRIRCSDCRPGSR